MSVQCVARISLSRESESVSSLRQSVWKFTEDVIKIFYIMKFWKIYIKDLLQTYPRSCLSPTLAYEGAGACGLRLSKADIGVRCRFWSRSPCDFPSVKQWECNFGRRTDRRFDRRIQLRGKLIFNKRFATKWDSEKQQNEMLDMKQNWQQSYLNQNVTFRNLLSTKWLAVLSTKYLKTYNEVRIMGSTS